MIFGRLEKAKKLIKDPAKVLIKSGEKLEVRYPYDWHLRTEIDAIYIHIDEKTLLENCLLFGKIKEETRTMNVLKLDAIIKDKKYIPANKL